MGFQRDIVHLAGILKGQRPLSRVSGGQTKKEKPERTKVLSGFESLNLKKD